jgi:ribosomal protein S18 acetylase RimI-like enzyme
MLDASTHRTKIKEITTQEEMELSVRIVRAAFQTVALEFGLTRQNNPTHPSFMEIEHMVELKARGMHLLGLFRATAQVGFVAIGPSSNGAFNLEKLAVLPQYRHEGYGKVLVRFAVDFAVAQQAKKVTLAIIDENTVLKSWYLGLGFKEASIKKFSHLPFTVCFMEYNLA